MELNFSGSLVALLCPFTPQILCRANQWKSFSRGTPQVWILYENPLSRYLERGIIYKKKKLSNQVFFLFRQFPLWSQTDHCKNLSYISLTQVLMAHFWGVQGHSSGTLVALLGANIAALTLHVKVPVITFSSHISRVCTDFQVPKEVQTLHIYLGHHTHP